MNKHEVTDEEVAQAFADDLWIAQNTKTDEECIALMQARDEHWAAQTRDRAPTSDHG
jgi:hypothetical protein